MLSSVTRGSTERSEDGSFASWGRELQKKNPLTTQADPRGTTFHTLFAALCSARLFDEILEGRWGNIHTRTAIARTQRQL